jgi:hypothetical protein
VLSCACSSTQEPVLRHLLGWCSLFLRDWVSRATGSHVRLNNWKCQAVSTIIVVKMRTQAHGDVIALQILVHEAHSGCMHQEVAVTRVIHIESRKCREIVPSSFVHPSIRAHPWKKAAEIQKPDPATPSHIRLFANPFDKLTVKSDGGVAGAVFSRTSL